MIVTDPVSVTPILDHEPIQMTGRQKGETEDGMFLYTVTYRTEEQASDSNVKVTTVTNRRPGIVLVKQDMKGNLKAGATFTLTEEGTKEVIGSYTTDKNGLITIAYLQNGKTYLLKEEASPSGLQGLSAAIKIQVQENGEVVIETASEDAGLCASLKAGSVNAVDIIQRVGLTEVEADADAPDAPAHVELVLKARIVEGGSVARRRE